MFSGEGSIYCSKKFAKISTRGHKIDRFRVIFAVFRLFRLISGRRLTQLSINFSLNIPQVNTYPSEKESAENIHCGPRNIFFPEELCS